MPAYEISNARRIRELADETPSAPVLWQVGPDGIEFVFTWSDLDRRSSQLAGALAARGLECGDRLGLCLPNSSQFTLGVLASWKVGAVPIPVRWDLPDWELQRLRAVIDSPFFLDPSEVPWIDRTADLPVPELDDAVSPQVNGICSSGSTGLPKVILVQRPSEYDPVLSTPLLEQWREVPRPERILVLGPMYHANGFSSLYRLLAGDRLVIMERFDAARVVDLIERHRISNFTATPTMLQRIADLPDIEQRDLSSIEWLLQGAAPLPPSLFDRWARLIGPERIVMAYGMTEGLGLTALRGDEWVEHPGSVGRGLRDTEIRILDEDGQGLPPGGIGDIYLRSVMSGGYSYLGGAPSLRGDGDGFETVGDVGYLDEDGFLYVVDRRVDLIITGGANVYPAEVEAALIEHPEIADVVVVGLRDREWGRRVHAVVEPRDGGARPGADEIIAYAKSRLAPYKVPKTVEFVDVIPRSAATKVNRRAMVVERGG
jgi:bile acid-coenzyme A ligase